MARDMIDYAAEATTQTMLECEWAEWEVNDGAGVFRVGTQCGVAIDEMES
jgi:hypothetical protein